MGLQSDTVRATQELVFKPITVPNFIIMWSPARPRQEGMQEAPKMAVADLSQDALDSLASRFLSDLYEKAGKRSPFYMTPGEDK